jgi:hypothetical protein
MKILLVAALALSMTTAALARSHGYVYQSTSTIVTEHPIRMANETWRRTITT